MSSIPPQISLGACGGRSVDRSGKDVASVKLWWMVPLVGCIVALFVAGPRHRVGIFGIDRDPVVFRNPPKEGPKDKQQGGWFLVGQAEDLTPPPPSHSRQRSCDESPLPRTPPPSQPSLGGCRVGSSLSIHHHLQPLEEPPHLLRSHHSSLW